MDERQVANSLTIVSSGRCYLTVVVMA